MEDIDRIVESIKTLTAQNTSRRPPVSEPKRCPARAEKPCTLEKAPSGAARLPYVTDVPPHYHCAGAAAAAEEVKRVEVVSEQDLVELLQHFIRRSFLVRVDDEFSMDVQRKCEALFRKDYICSYFRNSTGRLSPSYPYRLIYMQRELTRDERDAPDVLKRSDEMSEEASIVYEKTTDGAFARHQKRFPVSVMMYNGKHICRSANPAGEKEIFSRALEVYYTTDSEAAAASASPSQKAKVKSPKSPIRKKEDLVKKACVADNALLDAYKVSNILNFAMKRKNTSHIITPLSIIFRSSIVKSSWYKEGKFFILQVPYPDYTFFRKFSKQGTGNKLECDWMKEERTNPVCIPNGRQFEVPGLKWNQFREWDLDDLTKNYFKLLLSVVSKSENGLLIECVGGIDRTPLMVSLLRISLWADGKIHKSLMPVEIAYLVVAYDWYLFGHKLPERIRDGEEVLTFCFQAIKLIFSDDFCMHTCINPFFNPSMRDLPTGETGTLPKSESVLAEIGSICKDMDDVDPPEDPNTKYDLLFEEAMQREMDEQEAEAVRIAEAAKAAEAAEAAEAAPVPEEIPMTYRCVKESALMSSLKGIDVDKVFTVNEIRNTIEKCRCYSNIPDATTMDVLTWRVDKLQIIRAMLTACLSIAASRCLVTVHGMEEKPFKSYAASYYRGKRSFMKSLANLTISKFTWEVLCPKYETLCVGGAEKEVDDETN